MACRSGFGSCLCFTGGGGGGIPGSGPTDGRGDIWAARYDSWWRVTFTTEHRTYQIVDRGNVIRTITESFWLAPQSTGGGVHINNLYAPTASTDRLPDYRALRLGTAVGDFSRAIPRVTSDYNDFRRDAGADRGTRGARNVPPYCLIEVTATPAAGNALGDSFLGLVQGPTGFSQYVRSDQNYEFRHTMNGDENWI